MRLTVGRKIFGGFGIVLLLIAILGIISFLALARVDRISDKTMKLLYLDMFLDEKIGDHLRWMNDLGDQFLLNKDFEGELDSHNCDFGKWYDNFEVDDAVVMKIHKSIDAPHKKLHDSAKKIKETYEKADYEMDTLMSEAKAAHIAWMMSLRDTWQEGGVGFDKATDPAMCVFGKWFYSFKSDDPLLKPILAKIEKPHRELHLSAIKIKELAGADGVITDSAKIEKARIIFNEKCRPLADEIMRYFDRIKSVIHQRVKNNLRAKEVYVEETKAAEIEVQEKIGQLSDIFMERVDELIKSRSVMVLQSKRLILFSIALIVLLGAGIAAAITRGIIKTLRFLLGKTNEMADAAGDLTATVPISTNDEIGQLGKAYNKLIESLRGIVIQIRSAGLKITTSANQISSVSQDQAAGIQEEATQVSQVATSARQLAETAKQVTDLSNEIAKSSASTVQMANSGSQSVDNVVNGIEGVRESVLETAKKIEGLGERSHAVTEIIILIEDIADQTNLLSLNAAIEAARAGEAGRGFAVVADAIGKLADKTAKSTKDISELIEGIQKDTSACVMSMEKSTKETEESSSLAHEARESLKEIINGFEQVAQSTKQISLASQQQASGSKQISKAMIGVDEVMKQSAAGAKQSKESAKELAGLAEELKTAIGQFKLSKEEKKITK